LGEYSDANLAGAFNNYRSLKEFEELFRKHFRDFLASQIKSSYIYKLGRLSGRHVYPRTPVSKEFSGHYGMHPELGPLIMMLRETMEILIFALIASYNVHRQQRSG
jgi:hypothetical protein